MQNATSYSRLPFHSAKVLKAVGQEVQIFISVKREFPRGEEGKQGFFRMFLEQTLPAKCLPGETRGYFRGPPFFQGN